MKITVFDSGFVMKAGHHYSINKGLKNECEKRGIEFELLACKQIKPEVAEELGAKPFFTDWMYVHASDHPMSGYIENFIKINESYLMDLKRLPADHFKKGDIIIMHTMQYNILYGLAQWLKDKDPNNFPKIMIVCGLPGYFDYASNTFNVYGTLYHYAFKCLFETRVAGLISLTCATPGFAKQFSQLSEKPVRVIPIACPYANLGEDHDGARSLKPRDPNKKMITVSFFGHATGVKGLQYIPPIVPTVLDKFPNAEFQIHANPFEPFKKFAAEMQLKYGNRVRFLAGELTSDDYFLRMSESDILVLPYHPHYYRDSMSGIFLESGCLGKPMVVPEGSWMETEGRSLGTGIETFTGWDSNGLEVAVSRALANYATLSEKATAAGEKFRTKYSFSSFFDGLLGEESANAVGASGSKFTIKYTG